MEREDLLISEPIVRYAGICRVSGVSEIHRHADVVAELCIQKETDQVVIISAVVVGAAVILIATGKASEDVTLVITAEPVGKAVAEQVLKFGFVSAPAPIVSCVVVTDRFTDTPAGALA